MRQAMLRRSLTWPLYMQRRQHLLFSLQYTQAYLTASKIIRQVKRYRHIIWRARCFWRHMATLYNSTCFVAIEMWVSGYYPCKFMHYLYIAELYRLRATDSRVCHHSVFYTARPGKKLYRTRQCVATVQGHFGSSKLVPIESPGAISY